MLTIEAFSMTSVEQRTLKVFGEAHRVEDALKEIKKQFPSVKISGAPMDEEHAAQAPSGLDPITYFVVAYAAHVSASVTIDAIKSAIVAIAKKNGAKTDA